MCLYTFLTALQSSKPRLYSCILTHTIGVRADEGATRVSVAGGVTSAAGTDHVLGDVAWGGKKMRCSTNKMSFFTFEN